MYLIQTRKEGGRWVTRAEAATETAALRLYASYNTFGQYRKRLTTNEGKVLFSQVKELPWGVRW